MSLLVIALDRDVAGHLAVALRRHRRPLARLGYAEPPGLADLETLAQGVAKSHNESPGVSRLTVPDDDDSDPDYLTRTTSAGAQGPASRPSTGGSQPAHCHQSSAAEQDASTASTSTSFSQHDLRWLEHASPKQIDRALERGQLDQLLGQPSNATGSHHLPAVKAETAGKGVRVEAHASGGPAADAHNPRQGSQPRHWGMTPIPFTAAMTPLSVAGARLRSEGHATA